MKIKCIEYKNFRNFKEHGKITFDTNGKINIIYGDNGTGKTTFHQLFHWIIYGTTHFNKTTNSNKLYNLEVESETEPGDYIEVFGKLEFEHCNTNYSMTRKSFFNLTETGNNIKPFNETFSITKQNESLDWENVKNPTDFIEKLLPSGLSQYFFFDGENMISDLGKKGKESAESLKKAIFNLLGLDVYDKAIRVIGDDEKKSTVIGQLFMDDSIQCSDANVAKAKTEYETFTRQKQSLEQMIEKIDKKIATIEKQIESLSEQIGMSKSQKDYEEQRNSISRNIDSLNALLNKDYADFGRELLNFSFQQLLAKRVNSIGNNINIEAPEKKVVSGLTKDLIDALLEESDHCICGHKLGPEEREYLKKQYTYLPPAHYDSTYANFIDINKKIESNFDISTLTEIISEVSKYSNKIISEQGSLDDIISKQKEDKQFEGLIKDRDDLKNDKDGYVGNKNDYNKNLALVSSAFESSKKRYKSLLDENKNYELNIKKIKLMREVKQYFENIIEEKSNKYSQLLQSKIQNLLDKMLVAKREVNVDKNFTLIVQDKFKDESKSEGQFATISFAYIMGLFSVLDDEDIIINKEYPLILDAPFSKLSDGPKEKVLKYMPQYAPQVILFSKDKLEKSMDDESIGKVYTILSNEEQNVSYIKEGNHLEN